MRSWVRVLAACCVALVCLACGSSEDAKVVGEWKGQFLRDDGKKMKGANMTFSDDHRFRELYGNLEIKGSWKLSGKVLTLLPDTVNGSTIEEARKKILVKGNSKAAVAMAEGLDKPVPLTFSEDGKKLTAEPNAAAGGNTIYVKQ